MNQLFAVIFVDLNYDSIDGVECLATFPTKEEAEYYIEETKKKEKESFDGCLKYINMFVDKIEVPKDLKYPEWKEYLKQYSSFGSNWARPDNFKESLKSYLVRYKPKDIAGFNPPQVIRQTGYDLFVVEIK